MAGSCGRPSQPEERRVRESHPHQAPAGPGPPATPGCPVVLAARRLWVQTAAAARVLGPRQVPRAATDPRAVPQCGGAPRHGPTGYPGGRACRGLGVMGVSSAQGCWGPGEGTRGGQLRGDPSRAPGPASQNAACLIKTAVAPPRLPWCASACRSHVVCACVWGEQVRAAAARQRTAGCR
jgi:hypothetical protein